jgi:hypothetical protein
VIQKNHIFVIKKFSLSKKEIQNKKVKAKALNAIRATNNNSKKSK